MSAMVLAFGVAAGALLLGNAIALVGGLGWNLWDLYRKRHQHLEITAVTERHGQAIAVTFRVASTYDDAVKLTNLSIVPIEYAQRHPTNAKKDSLYFGNPIFERPSAKDTWVTRAAGHFATVQVEAPFPEKWVVAVMSDHGPAFSPVYDAP